MCVFFVEKHSANDPRQVDVDGQVATAFKPSHLVALVAQTVVRASKPIVSVIQKSAVNVKLGKLFLLLVTNGMETLIKSMVEVREGRKIC